MNDSSQFDDCEIVPGCLFEASRDPAELLELAEAASDKMVPGIDILIKRVLLGASGGNGRRHNRCRP